MSKDHILDSATERINYISFDASSDKEEADKEVSIYTLKDYVNAPSILVIAEALSERSRYNLYRVESPFTIPLIMIHRNLVLNEYGNDAYVEKFYYMRDGYTRNINSYVHILLPNESADDYHRTDEEIINKYLPNTLHAYSKIANAIHNCIDARGS